MALVEGMSMFFFGIFGIQQKDRSIKEFDNIICPDYVDELRRSDNVDFDRLKKMQMPSNLCLNCGSFINPNYAYCPFCGQKRS